MALTKESAKEILKVLGVKFQLGKGTMIDQATQAIKEKGYSLNDKDELLNEKGEIFGATITPPPDDDTKKNNSSKGKIKITMTENVLHDGDRYDKGKTYEVDKEINEIFTKKKFIEIK